MAKVSWPGWMITLQDGLLALRQY